MDPTFWAAVSAVCAALALLVAVVAAVIGGLQVRRARESVEAMRAQMTDGHVHRAREVHDELHDEMSDAIHALDPRPEALAGQLRNNRNAKNAEPHLVAVERLARRIGDVGAPDVADAYMAAHGSAVRVVDYFAEQLPNNGLPLGDVPRFADGFESLMRALNREAVQAEQAWRKWRTEQQPRAVEGPRSGRR